LKIEFTPIGIIHSPFTKPDGMPIQPSGARGVSGTVEVFEPFAAGINDLDGFSHVMLIYCFHRSSGYSLEVVPFLDTAPRGVFATRAPRRPNPVGLSIVRLKGVEGRTLHIENVDILDETPLLDIKPYVPEFDAQTDVRIGWLETVAKENVRKKSDDRFHK